MTDSHGNQMTVQRIQRDGAVFGKCFTGHLIFISTTRRAGLCAAELIDAATLAWRV
jgi:hypothetical protein